MRLATIVVTIGLLLFALPLVPERLLAGPTPCPNAVGAGRFVADFIPSAFACPGTPHAAIIINGNSGFNATNGVTGGSGTASNPYVISNWDIDLCQPGIVCAGPGIWIQNTNASFEIIGVNIHASGRINGFGYYDADIQLNSVSNGRILNNTLANGREGVHIANSNQITVSGNNISVPYLTMSTPSGGIVVSNACVTSDTSTRVTVSGNFLSPCVRGMDLIDSKAFTISGNQFVQDSSIGLFVESNKNNNGSIANNQFGPGTPEGLEVPPGAAITQTTISGNVFYGQGIDFTPPSVVTCCPANSLSGPVGSFSSDVITPDNLVNGKPIYYFQDCSGNNINSVPIGQLLVFNCTNFQASNLSFENVSDAIVLSHVNNVNISSVVINNISRFGLLAFNSTGLTFTNSSITAVNGIQFYLSSNMRVYHNNFLGGGDFAAGSQQGMDFQGSGDSWDNGYPSGGNFWWNYHGTDSCSGPQQNVCPSPDGIGDTAFGLDRYPLMKPLASDPPPDPPSGGGGRPPFQM